jgi:archaellum component FlaC
MPDEKKTGFSGIFSGLKKMVFTEDYLDTGNAADKETKPTATTTASSSKTPAPVPNNTGIITTNIASDDMVQKIYSLFETMNKPGIDFFELWNAAEAMGGVTVNNLQNAFTTLKVLGLDKDTVLNTGEAYCTELQNKLNADIQKKKDEKDSIAVALQNEKKQLERDKQDFENKIQLLSSQLAETTSKLSQLDSKYTPQIQSIETKIQSGVNALNVVVSEIKAVLITVKSNIN